MALYESADILNRRMTLSAAEAMTRDLLDSSSRLHKHAISSLKQQPTALRRTLVPLVEMYQKTPSPELARRFEKELASYLIATTQFHYNKATTSELARTIGPVLATFSKWPSAVAGDMMYNWEREGATRGTIVNMRKYLLPYIAAASAQQILLGSPSDMTDEEKYWIGKGGLQARLAGPAGLGLAEFRKPVVLEMMAPLIAAPLAFASTGDTDKLKEDLTEAITKAGGAFLPGQSLIRLLGQLSDL